MISSAKRAAVVCALALGGTLAAAPAAKRATPREGAPPIDFSGVWELDPSLSSNPPRQMQKAILSVTQRGNRIWIAPTKVDPQGSLVMAEEIVADGKPYEKALGPAGKGVVTADWSKDGQALWIDVRAGPPEDRKKNAIQRSVWKLSADRKFWVRESVTINQGAPHTVRLVFRRTTPPSTPTPTRGRRPTAVPKRG